MIAYTHLGINSECDEAIARETQRALRNLATEYEKGEIYVTTTSKLLNYNVAHNHLTWKCSVLGPGEIGITVQNIRDPVRGEYVPTLERLQGITFSVPNHVETRLFVGEQEFLGFRRSAVDHSGMYTVMFPRTFLQYPHRYR